MNTILIAEDEKFIRRGIRVMIERAPVPVGEILEAHDGTEALEILRSRPVDVLVTDIRMPHMDGVELVAQLDNLAHRPLVLVISGYGDFDYAVAMLRGGAQDYLLKPVEREKLYAALQKMEDLLAEAEAERRSETQQYHHALRYLMLDGDAGSKERGELLARYTDRFMPGAYIGLCTAAAPKEPSTIPAGVIHLHDIGALSLLVAPAQQESDVLAVLDGPVGISTEKTGLAALYNCHTEAFAAWKRAFFIRQGEPIIRAGGEAPAGKPNCTAQHLVDLVGLSRAAEAVRQLTGEARRVENGELSPDSFCELCAAFVKELHETYRNIMDTGEDLARFGDVWAFADSRSYLGELSDWLDGFCAHIAQEFADYENKQKIRTAVQYIQKNYAKPLNMAMVSNEVSMNYSLFSLLFKQYTGTNFVNYLQKLRLDEARRLLTETDWKVNEIGRRVGFADDKHFLKVFKAAVGLSPTEYRRAAATRGAGAE